MGRPKESSEAFGAADLRMQSPPLATILREIIRANKLKATAGYGHGESATLFDSFGWASRCLQLDSRRYHLLPRHQHRPKILMDPGTGTANPNMFFRRFFEYNIVISNRPCHRDWRLHQAMNSSQTDTRPPAKQTKCLGANLSCSRNRSDLNRKGSSYTSSEK
jgi:hypothetical protein